MVSGLKKFIPTDIPVTIFRRFKLKVLMLCLDFIGVKLLQELKKIYSDFAAF